MKVIAGHDFEPGAYWMGLVESDLEYKWTDSSIVDYLPKLGVIVDSSRKWRIQDCFALNITVNNNSKSDLLLGELLEIFFPKLLFLAYCACQGSIRSVKGSIKIDKNGPVKDWYWFGKLEATCNSKNSKSE